MKAYLLCAFLCCFAVYFGYRAGTSKKGLYYETEAMQTFMLFCLILGFIGVFGLWCLILRDIGHWLF